MWEWNWQTNFYWIYTFIVLITTITKVIKWQTFAAFSMVTRLNRSTTIRYTWKWYSSFIQINTFVLSLQVYLIRWLCLVKRCTHTIAVLAICSQYDSETLIYIFLYFYFVVPFALVMWYSSYSMSDFFFLFFFYSSVWMQWAIEIGRFYNTHLNCFIYFKYSKRLMVWRYDRLLSIQSSALATKIKPFRIRWPLHSSII